MQQNWVTAPQASCFFEIKHQDLQHRVTRVIQLREVFHFRNPKKKKRVAERKRSVL